MVLVSPLAMALSVVAGARRMMVPVKAANTLGSNDTARGQVGGRHRLNAELAC